MVLPNYLLYQHVVCECSPGPRGTKGLLASLARTENLLFVLNWFPQAGMSRAVVATRLAE